MDNDHVILANKNSENFYYFEKNIIQSGQKV